MLDSFNPRKSEEIHAWREEQRRQRAGHHGVNAYKCPKCELVTATIDVDPGVTPMFLGCRRTPGCDGMAVSAGYPMTDPPLELLEHLDWEWYLPNLAELANMKPESQRHIREGGLALRPRTAAPSAYRDGYWGGIMPPARDGDTPIFDLTVEQAEMAADYVPAAKVVEDDRVPPGLAVPTEFLEPDFGKAPRNRAERRAAAKAAGRGKTAKVDRRIRALMASMTPEEIAAANRLADQQLGER